MESEKISQNPTVNKKTKSTFSILLAILFFVWTPLLIYETFKVQNSCEPMIQWSKETQSRLSKECKTNDSLISKSKSQVIKGFNQGMQFFRLNYTLNDSNAQTIEKKPDKKADLIGAVSGTVAATIATVLNAPVVIVSGVAIAIWFIVRTIILSL